MGAIDFQFFGAFWVVRRSDVCGWLGRLAKAASDAVTGFERIGGEALHAG
jgi:hypothetical protein